ncbi:unnamed protein product [Boreogadus saida]
MGRVCPPRGIVFLGTLKDVLHSGIDALSAHTKHHHPHHHQQLKQIHNHTGNRAPHVQQHLPQETTFSSVSAALLACIHPSPHLPICPLSSLPLSSSFAIPLSFSPSPLHLSLLDHSFPPSLFPFLPISSILCLLSLLSCSSLPLSSLSPPPNIYVFTVLHLVGEGRLREENQICCLTCADGRGGLVFSSILILMVCVVVGVGVGGKGG